jgi:hypothetical protein
MTYFNRWPLRFLFLVLLCGSPLCASATTYYIDYVAGSDTNDGRSKATPWKAHPYMACRTGGSYAHAAGDRFIFKGGVTWPHGCFQMTIAAGGTPSNVDYYGADASWFNGASWTRPVFNGEHQPLAGGGSLVYFGNQSNIIIDNLEIRGHRTFVNANATASIDYNCPTNLTMSNLWVHDWSVAPGVSQDNGQGGIYGNIPRCSPTTIWVEYSELSNAEWTGTGRQSGAALRGGNCRYCVIHDVSTGILHGTMHDTHMFNVAYAGNDSFDPSFHTNSLYVDEWAGVSTDPGTVPALIYNNYIHDVGSGSGAIYALPYYSVNTTIYIFNNIVRNTKWLGAVNIDTDGGTAASVGRVYIWNNTFQVGPDGNGFDGVRVTTGSGRPPLNTLVMQNNHSVNDNSFWGGGSVVSFTNNSNLLHSNAQATAAGYTALQPFVYAPSSVSSPTINSGINLSSQCATVPALCSDTAYGARVVAHIVSWPARPVMARPSSGPWDIGAYKWTTGGTLPPPTNLRVM